MYLTPSSVKRILFVVITVSTFLFALCALGTGAAEKEGSLVYATHAVKEGVMILARDVEQRTVSQAEIPGKAFCSVLLVVGKKPRHDIVAGQIMSDHDLDYGADFTAAEEASARREVELARAKWPGTADLFWEHYEQKSLADWRFRLERSINDEFKNESVFRSRRPGGGALCCKASFLIGRDGDILERCVIEPSSTISFDRKALSTIDKIPKDVLTPPLIFGFEVFGTFAAGRGFQIQHVQKVGRPRVPDAGAYRPP